MKVRVNFNVDTIIECNFEKILYCHQWVLIGYERSDVEHFNLFFVDLKRFMKAII